MKPTFPRPLLYFLALLILINLLQSHFTELLFDEAYYWYYAQNMAWGYFDHPPMVALLVKLGSLLFSGELGLRFMSCLLSAGTVALIWLLSDNPAKVKYAIPFCVLVFSIALLNAYGFFTLPDTPLLFFTALFLWLYKKFVRSPSVPLAVGLGCVMAALMYSKYHALLVILFVLLSNMKLLRSGYAWLAVFVALLCYLPHLHWLYENDFIPISYHLFERPNRAYEFGDFTLGYFVNLIALFGFTFPWIYLALFRARQGDLFTKALRYLSFGVLVFFFISSFQRRVQAQWLIVICIPMAVLAFSYMMHNKSALKWIFRLGILNGIIILWLRAGLIYQPLFPVVFETHGNRKWVEDIASQAGEVPVVFQNSYREAPMYAFYSGHSSYSLNNVYYRQNQYSIDDAEEGIQGRKVLIISKGLKQGDISYTTPQGKRHYGNYMDRFLSYRKLRCYVEGEGPMDDNRSALLKVYNPYDRMVALDSLRFGAAFLNGYKDVLEVQRITALDLISQTSRLAPSDTAVYRFRLPKPRTEQPAYYRITIAEKELPWGLNGKSIPLE